MINVLKNKTLLGVVGLIVVLFLGYNFFSGGDVVIGTSTSPTVGADLLKLSEEISKATLDQDLFTNPGYIRLIDFGAPLQQEPLGRRNPFDILGRD